EIVRIPLGEKRLAGAQGRVMDTQMFLQNLAALVEALESSERVRAATIIAAQIGRGLFALEDGGDTDARFLRAVGGNVGPVTASRQRNFERANRVAVFLRPKEREAFELEVRRGFAALFVIPS